MSQRPSGYQRQPRDKYETPVWVTSALGPHIPTRIRRIWEPAAGSGKMAAALRALGFSVDATDIDEGRDFLKARSASSDAIITNPPFGLAQEFLEHALELIAPKSGVVAMLLRVDYDSALTRTHLFAGCQAFAKKIVLTRRIVWFERPGAAPSFNHAWFIWDHQHRGAPTIAYHIESRLALRQTTEASDAA